MLGSVEWTDRITCIFAHTHNENYHFTNAACKIGEKRGKMGEKRGKMEKKGGGGKEKRGKGLTQH